MLPIRASAYDFTFLGGDVEWCLEDVVAAFSSSLEEEGDEEEEEEEDEDEEEEEGGEVEDEDAFGDEARGEDDFEFAS